jgi:predicted ATP-grasp superfamily ATP-dependent carboligase
MSFSKIKQTEMIYHLNDERWTLETLKRLIEEIEHDGFDLETEISIDFKNGSVRALAIYQG